MGDVEREELLMKNMDGKVLQKEFRPYARLELDLGSARNMEEHDFKNSLIYVEDLDGNCAIKLNYRNAETINLKKRLILITPFDKIYATNASQSGKTCKLLIANADFFRVAIPADCPDHARLHEIKSVLDHSDIDISALADDKILVYDAATGNFVFQDKPTGGAATFLELTDTPASYSGSAGKFTKVNSGESALEFGTPATTFLGLADTPASYSGHAGKFPKVNSGESALEFAKSFKIVAEVVLGSDATSIQVTNLDLNADRIWYITLVATNPTGSDENVAFYINGNTTPTNYYSQRLYATGTLVAADRANTATSMRLPSTFTKSGSALMIVARDPDSKFRLISHTTMQTGVGIYFIFYAVAATFSVANVTQVDIVADQTNGLKTGTRLIILGAS